MTVHGTPTADPQAVLTTWRHPGPIYLATNPPKGPIYLAGDNIDGFGSRCHTKQLAGGREVGLINNYRGPESRHTSKHTKSIPWCVRPMPIAPGCYDRRDR